jgi:hypothetical protein
MISLHGRTEKEMVVTLTYNNKERGRNCFKIHGGKRDAGKHLAFSIDDVAEIIALHRLGFFDHMINEKCAEKEISLNSSPVHHVLPTSSPATRVLPPTPVVHTPPSSPTSSAGSGSDGESTATSGSGSSVYQAWLRKLKTENAGMTHAQAQAYTKTPEGKAAYTLYKADSARL